MKGPNAALLFFASLLLTAAPTIGQSTEEAEARLTEKDKTCATCHTDSKYTRRYPQIAVSHATLADTVHARFHCLDCHYEGYDDYPHNKLKHRANCGECHEEQREDYHKSRHHQARTDGNFRAPDCVDCHGFHEIKPPKEDLVGPRSIGICVRCHGDQGLNQQFQLKADVVKGFESSYHGQMYRLGFEGDRYATCVACHDNHAILGKDHPDSTIARANIVKTCAECHEDANDGFVTYLTHWSPGGDVVAGDENAGISAGLDRVFYFMEALLWSVMIFFGLHTFLWFVRTTVAKGPATGVSKVHAPGRTIRRFTGVARVSHVLMILCFLSLSLTGLPVKFADSDISRWIANNIIGYGGAATLHRVAGITLCLLFAAHIGWLLARVFVKKERGLFWGPNSLVPNGKDAKDFVQHVSYFLFLRKEPPKFDRWTYWEKFDYLAVFWGMVMIGVTGLLMMSPTTSTSFFPGWALNVAHVIHSEEALLATAFVFVVHFFNTHLRPNAFPIDDVIFTGRMSIDQLKEERPLEYERLQASGQLEALLVEPLAEWKVTVWRLTGFLFVLVGLALLVLILTSIL